VKSNLLNSADQLIDLRLGVVIFNRRLPGVKIHPRQLYARDLRKLFLNTPDARIAGHSIYFEFHFGLRHILMMRPETPGMPQCYAFAPVARFAVFLLFIGFAASRLLAEGGFSDPAFSQIPFDQWLSQPDNSHMHWSARVSETELSAHQRLTARVFVEVDGAELAKRRGAGQFLVLVQVNDEKGQTWQNHQEVDLEHIEAGIKSSDAVFSQLFFALPGDYRVAIAIFATATEEHSILKRKLHVSALRNDPLPDAWRDLPAVEFFSPSMPPDNWYLPSIEGKLHLAVATHEPVHVSLVVNLTAAERLTGSARVQNRNWSVLLPATKVLSQVDWGNATFSLALLDLSRRRVTYQQGDTQELDWSKAGASLLEVNPGVIDVKSLENRKHSAQFFLDEIRRRIGKSKGSPVVIVLSSAVEFEPGQEIRPLTLDTSSGARVFYIRYQPLMPVTFSRRPRPNGTLAARPEFVAPIDQLAPLLKPLDPRLFEVATPEQFRKALAAILSEMKKL
jgi:hypothetical protein